jgi:hypothetical protein
MKFGRPELFHDKVSVRLAAIDRAIAQYEHSSQQLFTTFEHKLDPNVVEFIKGFGNEINLLSAFRDLYFNSRELLDFLLGRLHSNTASTRHQTPKDFTRFFKGLVAGDYDSTGLKTIKFLKENSNYIFHIRKIRNLLKNNPAAVEFIYTREGFLARFELPLDASEITLIPYLDILNPQDALNRKAYSATLKLRIAFPEIKDFWNQALNCLKEDGL